MSNLAINDAGDVLAFDGKAWKPAQIAENDQGMRVVFDGAAWQPLDKIVGASKGQQAQNASDALGSAVGRGVTFGAGDELGASVRAMFPSFSNWMMGKSEFEKSLAPNQNPPAQTVSNAPTYDQRYEEELARMRAQASADKEAHPTLTTAGEIGGNVLGTAALAYAPVAGALVRGGGASGLGMNVLRGAATGAVLGGAQGFAEGEGGAGNRVSNAVVPAMIGGAVGAAAPVVAKGAQYVYERAAPATLKGLADLGEKFAPRIKPGDKGFEKMTLSAAAPDDGPGILKDSWIANASQSARDTAKSIEEQAATKRLAQTMAGRSGVDQVQGRLSELGDGAMIADANTGTRRTLFAQQAKSDDAADVAGKNFLARNQAAGTRFKSNVPGAPDPSRAEEFLSAYKTAEGAKIYDPVLRSGQPLNVTPELDALMQRPAIKKAFETVDRWAAENGAKLTQAERFHMVKQALNSNADALFQTGTAVNKNMVNSTASEWEQALWKANSSIKEADAAYAKIAGLHDDWFKRGQAFAAQGKGEAGTAASPDAIKEYLRGATPQQMQAFQAGAAAEMRRIASQGGDATRRLGKTLGEGDDMVARLTEVFGPEQTRKILASGNAERVFAETFKDTMRGSPTAERTITLARDADLMPAGGDATSLLRWVKDNMAKLDTPTEATRVRLAEILTTMDKEEQKVALEAVRRYLAQQRGATFKPGVAGSAAASVAPNQ